MYVGVVINVEVYTVWNGLLFQGASQPFEGRIAWLYHVVDRLFGFTVGCNYADVRQSGGSMNERIFHCFGKFNGDAVRFKDFSSLLYLCSKFHLVVQYRNRVDVLFL